MKKLFKMLILSALISSLLVSAATAETRQVESNSSYHATNPFNNVSTNISDISPIMNIQYGDEARSVLNMLKKEGTRSYFNSQSEVTDFKYQELLRRNSSQPYNLIQPTNTKAWYRAEFTALALAMGALSCPTAGNHLFHSLQDDPDDRTYPAGHSLSNGFSLTSSYTEIAIPMAAAIDAAHASNKTIVSGTGSHYTTAGNAGLDWYLTIGKYSYIWAAEKNSNGKWTVYVNINDKYDYETIYPLPSSFPQNLITLVTNHAADAQEEGAIVPYWIHMYMVHENYSPQ